MGQNLRGGIIAWVESQIMGSVGSTIGFTRRLS